MTWGQLSDYAREKALQAPPIRLVRPILEIQKKRANPINLFLTKLISHILFAYFVDFIIMLLGYKRM